MQQVQVSDWETHEKTKNILMARLLSALGYCIAEISSLTNNALTSKPE
jgi:hypothetical protein